MIPTNRQTFFVLIGLQSIFQWVMPLLNFAFPTTVAYYVMPPLGVGKVMGSMLGPNRVIAEDVKSYTYTVVMSDPRH